MTDTQRTQDSRSNTPISEELIDRIIDVKRRYPDLIPGSNVTVADFAMQVAARASERFSFPRFESALLREHSIEKDFINGWSRGDALSRWFALGFICLTQCSLTTTWNSELTLEVGNQTYSAAVECMWLWWDMPDAIRERVQHFMGHHITDITSSLRGIVDEASQCEWFCQYSIEMKGGNPRWKNRGNYTPQHWEVRVWNLLSADLTLNAFLNLHFAQSSDHILKLVRLRSRPDQLEQTLIWETPRDPIL